MKDSTKNKKQLSDENIRLRNQIAELEKKLADSIHTGNENKQSANLALIENKQTIQSIFEQSTDGILLINEEGIIIGWNKGLEKITKIGREEVFGRSCIDVQNRLLPDNLNPDEKCDIFTSKINQYQNTGQINWQTQYSDTEIKNSHGEIVYIQQYLHPFITPKGVTFVIIIRDVTEKKLSELALHEREKQFRTVLQNMPVMMCANNKSGVFLVWNTECERVTGYSSDEIVGKANIANILYPTKEHREYIIKQRSKKAPDFRDWEIQIKTKTGETKTVLWSNFTENFPIPGWESWGIGIDITELKKAENAQKVSEERLRKIIDLIPHYIYARDEDGNVLLANKASANAFGTTPIKIIGKNIRDFIDDKEYADRILQIDKELIENKKTLHSEIQSSTDRDGITREFEITKIPCDFPGFERKSILGISIDVTERQRVEEALRENEEKYRALFETSRDALGFATPGGTILDVNQAWLDIFGYTRDETIGHNISMIYLDPESRSSLKQELEEKGYIKDYEVKYRTKSGKILDCVVTANVRYDDEGNILYWQTNTRDITEHKHMESQLIQAQKMESIGRLAGGIAHDFNNLLTVIIGRAELALVYLKSDNPMYVSINEIKTTADRAAALVRQLLAFSRRQIIKPQIINLNALLLDMDDMLYHLLNKNIKLIYEPAKKIWTVKADQSQIEQIVTNLIVNARDAMPDGGTITIETANKHLGSGKFDNQLNVKPGDYVMLSIRDTGTGMDEEILSHIFEPFFTTKDIGKGTGLGLSTCYGIIQQNEGHIEVFSEPRKGTTINVYFPKNNDIPEDAPKLQKKTTVNRKFNCSVR
ncbi:MAG: PAS domain S-box protein [Candidatus Latescibacteria bacterium]|nr:PAS domain S-box protein [Candidatus Latescibacterota bacterium]